MPTGIGGSTVTDGRWANHAHVETEGAMTTPRPLRIATLLVCMVGLPIVAFWMGGRFHEAREIGKDYLSQSKFSQIEAMLLLYHDKHGAFPPSKCQTEAGGPMHSWRVLLVPYTARGFMERYSGYDFSQVWNSSNNLHALAGMPHFTYYKMSGEGDIANYLTIGEGDEWPSKTPLKTRFITKGNDRFLLVEYPGSDIHWMEPRY